jgi:hypothetical protein
MRSSSFFFFAYRIGCTTSNALYTRPSTPSGVYIPSFFTKSRYHFKYKNEVYTIEPIVVFLLIYSQRGW